VVGELNVNVELERILNETIITLSRYYPDIFLEVLRKTTKISVRITDVPSKIGSEHLPNRNIERYRYASLLVDEGKE
jgi:hypothetical protein